VILIAHWLVVTKRQKITQMECSETPAYKIQTPGNYPKESIQHTEHGESLKLRKNNTFLKKITFLIKEGNRELVTS